LIKKWLICNNKKGVAVLVRPFFWPSMRQAGVTKTRADFSFPYINYIVYCLTVSRFERKIGWMIHGGNSRVGLRRVVD